MEKAGVDASLVEYVIMGQVLTAGAGQMPARQASVAGGIGWVTSMTWAGYLLGAAVPNIGDHIHIVVGVVIFLSLIPIFVELIRERRRRSA